MAAPKQSQVKWGECKEMGTSLGPAWRVGVRKASLQLFQVHHISWLELIVQGLISWQRPHVFICWKPLTLRGESLFPHLTLFSVCFFFLFFWNLHRAVRILMLQLVLKLGLCARAFWVCLLAPWTAKCWAGYLFCSLVTLRKLQGLARKKLSLQCWLLRRTQISTSDPASLCVSTA